MELSSSSEANIHSANESRNSLHVMEPKDSLPCSQELTTCH